MTANRKGEAGYALLFVYALAASVAIMLYMELPKVVFEAQRDKEQLLIDRGEQYSRAIQLYVRKYNRFPIDMDALEKTQGIRFLRRKYVDPMTGKDDWRVIHVGPGGQFTDSLVHSPKSGDKNGPQTFITEMQQIGGNGPASGQGVNLASRTRPSDQAATIGQASEFGGQPVSGPVMVLPDGRIVPANSSGQAPPPPAAGGLPGQPIPQPGQPAQSAGGPGFGGIQTPNGIAVQPGGAGIPPPPVGGPPNAASDLINRILTSPRPQPATGGGIDQNGSPAGQALSSGQAGQVVGGGFAGVASKLEQEGIKSYGERTAYNEWEFVYDITKDPSRAPGGNRTGTQTGAATQNPVGQQQLGGGGLTGRGAK